MKVFKFGNFEKEIDVTDVEFIEKYELATEEYSRETESLPVDGKASETMKSICNSFFKTFDTTLGEGASRKMFGDKKSVDLCVEAFTSFAAFVQDYSATLEKVNAVSPNRAARRAKK